MSKEFKRWFNHDDVYVLLTDPLNIKEFYLVCDKGEIVGDFRNKSIISEGELRRIVGNTLPHIEDKPLIIDTKNKIQEEYCITDKECKSWLGARMQTSTDKNIGYVILHNKVAEYSYEKGEDQFIDEFSDFVALILADFRKDQRADSLNKLKTLLLEEKIPPSKALYKIAQEALNEMYGFTPLAITRIGCATGAHGLVHNSIPNFRERFDADETLATIIKAHIERTRIISEPSPIELYLEYADLKLFCNTYAYRLRKEAVVS